MHGRGDVAVVDRRADHNRVCPIEHVALHVRVLDALEPHFRTDLPRRRRMNNELNFPQNFERLVLGCIDADF